MNSCAHVDYCPEEDEASGGERILNSVCNKLNGCDHLRDVAASRARRSDGRRYLTSASDNVHDGNADYRLREPRSADKGAIGNRVVRDIVCKCFRNAAAIKVEGRSTCNAYSYERSILMEVDGRWPRGDGDFRGVRWRG